MKKLTKIALGIFAILLSTNLFAQKVNINAGLNMSTFTNPQNFSPKLKPGFHVGASLDYTLSDLFSIEGGLLLNSMGCRVDEDVDPLFGGGHTEGSITPYYLTIPVLLKANFKIGNVQAFAGVGPYVAFGLFGNSKSTYTSVDGASETTHYKVHFGENGHFNTVDFGIRAKAGIELDKINLGLFYGQGLINANPWYNSRDHSIKNSVFGLTLGYTIFQK